MKYCTLIHDITSSYCVMEWCCILYCRYTQQPTQHNKVETVQDEYRTMVQNWIIHVYCSNKIERCDMVILGLIFLSNIIP